MSRFNRVLYMLLGSGVALAFLGHGILGAKGKDTFIGLVTGSYKELLPGTIGADTGRTIVHVIGAIDITLAALMIGLVLAAAYGRRLALSTGALAIFVWASFWGFATALSRFTAEMDLAQIWDFVERGPNYFLPAALAYLIHRNRREGALAAAHGRTDRQRPAYTGGRPAIPSAG